MTLPLLAMKADQVEPARSWDFLPQSLKLSKSNQDAAIILGTLYSLQLVLCVGCCLYRFLKFREVGCYSLMV